METMHSINRTKKKHVLPGHSSSGGCPREWQRRRRLPGLLLGVLALGRPRCLLTGKRRFKNVSSSPPFAGVRSAVLYIGRRCPLARTVAAVGVVFARDGVFVILSEWSCFSCSGPFHFDVQNASSWVRMDSEAVACVSQGEGWMFGAAREHFTEFRQRARA